MLEVERIDNEEDGRSGNSGVFQPLEGGKNDDEKENNAGDWGHGDSCSISMMKRC
jgi:hypothetical protein